MAKRSKFFQKTREIEVKKDSSHAEQSSYWDDVSRHSFGDTIREDVCANPDKLAETESGSPSSPQLLMGEAIAHLQGRQRECYLLTMREGKSLSETGEVLGITKRSAQQYKDRAIKFIAQYCRAAIAKGRV